MDGERWGARGEEREEDRLAKEGRKSGKSDRAKEGETETAERQIESRWGEKEAEERKKQEVFALK